jgi:glycine cleavage system aminomethyltransferase T
VRTGVSSPRLGGIALAMVRREVEPGASLSARWEGGESRADVSALPFPT